MSVQLMTVALFGTSATALSISKAISFLLRRQEPVIWESPDRLGDTFAIFGNDRVYAGTCTPDKIMDHISSVCSGEAGACIGPTTLDCSYQGTTLEITIDFEDSLFQTWIKNGLIDGLRAAMKVEEVTVVEQTWTSIPGGCSTCPPANGQFIDTYRVPSHAVMTHQNEGGAPDKLSFRISNGSENDPGLCEVLITIAESVAGAINGVAGSAFGLASLACG